jgi:hypothetical protein
MEGDIQAGRTDCRKHLAIDGKTLTCLHVKKNCTLGIDSSGTKITKTPSYIRF